jgi:hypothetical protein
VVAAKSGDDGRGNAPTVYVPWDELAYLTSGEPEPEPEPVREPDPEPEPHGGGDGGPRQSPTASRGDSGAAARP